MRKAGRVGEAIAAYKRLLAIKPNLSDSWYNLAWLQRQVRASYARALDVGVREPEEVHLNRAVIYADHLHQPEEAERELCAALEKSPTYVPSLLNLGNVREDLGDRDGARAAYSQALAADPNNMLALARLAGLSHAPELDVALAKRLRSINLMRLPLNARTWALHWQTCSTLQVNMTKLSLSCAQPIRRAAELRKRPTTGARTSASSTG